MRLLFTSQNHGHLISAKTLLKYSTNMFNKLRTDNLFSFASRMLFFQFPRVVFSTISIVYHAECMRILLDVIKSTVRFSKVLSILMRHTQNTFQKLHHPSNIMNRRFTLPEFKPFSSSHFIQIVDSSSNVDSPDCSLIEFTFYSSLARRING